MRSVNIVNNIERVACALEAFSFHYGSCINSYSALSLSLCDDPVYLLSVTSKEVIVRYACLSPIERDLFHSDANREIRVHHALEQVYHQAIY